MEAARLADLKKFVAIGTACSYPGYLEGHLKESDLWAGPCHASVVNYGLTKKMMAVQAQAYKRQYGLDSIHLILTNLYGPGDSYNPERSHVVAALVRKWVEAEQAKAPERRGLGHRQAGPRVHLRRGLRRRHRPGGREVRRRRDPAQHRHRHRHLDQGARRDRPRGQRLPGQDDLADRQARRRRVQGPRHDPDEATSSRLDAADEAPRRPGQDGRLVPGQQGPGGRQMVITGRKIWPDRRPRAEIRSEPGPSRGRPTIRVDSVVTTPAQAAPLRQPVLLARPRLHGAAPGRPRRAPRRAGPRGPRPLRPRGLQAGHAPAASREVHNGVQIHRVAATSFGRKSTLHRMIDYLSFYFRAFVLALFLPRFDVVATLTTPPIIGLIGTFLRRLKGSRHVYWSMDLHPDASIALGRMSLEEPGRRLARLAQRRGLSPGRQGGRPRPVHGRPDRRQAGPPRPPGHDPGLEPPRRDLSRRPRRARAPRPRSAWPTSSWRCTPGNLGLAHSFAEIIEAARRLRDRDDVVFLFVGGGPRLAEVRAAKEAEGLDNIRLLDYFPREQLHASLSVADVHLITMRAEMTGVVVPGKLYGAMASGRPTLFVGPAHCESADTIRQADCGLTVRLGDPDGLVEALDRPRRRPRPRRRDSADGAGRPSSPSHEKDHCCSDWAAMIGDLLAEPAPGRPRPRRPEGRGDRRPVNPRTHATGELTLVSDLLEGGRTSRRPRIVDHAADAESAPLDPPELHVALCASARPRGRRRPRGPTSRRTSPRSRRPTTGP